MRLKSYLGIFFVILWAASCVNPPEDYPSIPEIEFESLEFIPTAGSDSLIFGFDFRDAEGDLGLSSTDIFPPFNPLEYQRDPAGNLITYANHPQMPRTTIPSIGKLIQSSIIKWYGIRFGWFKTQINTIFL